MRALFYAADINSAPHWLGAWSFGPLDTLSIKEPGLLRVILN
jgi:hypothetical protein